MSKNRYEPSPHKGFLRGAKQRAYDLIDRFGEMEPTQIANITGQNVTSIGPILREMCDEGILNRRKNGLTFIYFIPKKGSN